MLPISKYFSQIPYITFISFGFAIEIRHYTFRTSERPFDISSLDTIEPNN